MIPLISKLPESAGAIRLFLTELTQSGYNGDVATHYAERLIMSTDNSIYQCLPDAVLFPRSGADVALIARLAGEARFTDLVFAPRGGGTGTNGQSLNHGIVVDLSRHMNRILNVNLAEGWVQAEAGVIKDQLNEYLRPLGYFFAPELSTSNRATLGGMINTDASGQGSRVYGKTSDHVLGLRAVLPGGEMIYTELVSIEQAENIASSMTAEGSIYHTVLTQCREKQPLILDKFPSLNRFLTGYDLRHVLSDDLQSFDLSRILCGSEGTLAFITEARLNILPLPKVRWLVNIKYDSFDSALRNAPMMVNARALSVETVDSTVLNLAREDIIWHSVRDLITDVPDKRVQGLNIVEFAGDDVNEINLQVTELCSCLDSLMAGQQAGVLGYQVCNDLSAISRIYAMRKKAVGLLGNAPGRAKPIPFVEDTAVPPEKLADYIIEFRAILDSYGLTYGMFGHVDAGVLHVRPALDMCDPQQEMWIKAISDQVAALTQRYGGLLWGEHGKGFRAEYSPAVFGQELYTVLRHIKAAFDPHNQLNPGKICAPAGSDDQMMKVTAEKRGTFDRQIPVAVRDAWRGPLTCNGNGLCFNFARYSPMCPSMKITQNRVHSPKGRAALIREWLRLLAEQGVDLQALEQQLAGQTFSLRAVLNRMGNSWRACKGEYDFSHEVKEAMLGCLSCKACSTQCPVKIDVPAFRARFLQLYHTRYLRPVRDHLVAGVESYLPYMARLPGIFNFFMRLPGSAMLGQRAIGMADLPLLSSPTLRQQLAGHPATTTTLERLEMMSPDQRARQVLVVQDPFTSYYEAKVVADCIHLIERLGYQPVLLPFSPNGKPQYIKGFLHRFARTAQKTADMLNRVASLRIPMVGVDPALVLCYRDEYQDILRERRGDFQVLLVHEWLQQAITEPPEKCVSDECWYLLSHCTERTALPETAEQWKDIFARFGLRLETLRLGCCGMAGTYGHEVANLEHSRGIYGLSWQKALETLPLERCLSTGYSCRSQVKRIEGKPIQHPLQVLLAAVRTEP